MLYLLFFIIVAGVYGGVKLSSLRSELRRLRELMPELGIAWIEAESKPERAEGLRRPLVRLELLADAFQLPPQQRQSLRLAAMLPRLPADTFKRLPASVRLTYALQHQRVDGLGSEDKKLVPPLEAQLLGLASWLDCRLGGEPTRVAEALEEESGQRFSAEVVNKTIPLLGQLGAATSFGVLRHGKVRDGVLIVGLIPGGTRAELMQVEFLFRRSLRSGDRVFRSAEEVLVWLPDTDLEGAWSALRRIESRRQQSKVQLGMALAGPEGEFFEALAVEAREQALTWQYENRTVPFRAVG